MSRLDDLDRARQKRLVEMARAAMDRINSEWGPSLDPDSISSEKVSEAGRQAARGEIQASEWLKILEKWASWELTRATDCIDEIKRMAAELDRVDAGLLSAIYRKKKGAPGVSEGVAIQRAWAEFKAGKMAAGHGGDMAERGEESTGEK